MLAGLDQVRLSPPGRHRRHRRLTLIGLCAYRSAEARDGARILDRVVPLESGSPRLLSPGRPAVRHQSSASPPPTPGFGPLGPAVAAADLSDSDSDTESEQTAGSSASGSRRSSLDWPAEWRPAAGAAAAEWRPAAGAAARVAAGGGADSGAGGGAGSGASDAPAGGGGGTATGSRRRARRLARTVSASPRLRDFEPTAGPPATSPPPPPAALEGWNSEWSLCVPTTVELAALGEAQLAAAAGRLREVLAAVEEAAELRRRESLEAEIEARVSSAAEKAHLYTMGALEWHSEERETSIVP